MCEELMTDVCCVALEQTAVGLPNSLQPLSYFWIKTNDFISVSVVMQALCWRLSSLFTS